MIAIIRISGKIEMPQREGVALDRLRLRKKFCCVLLREKDSGVLKRIRNFVAFGKIDKETLIELIKIRGKSLSGKKIDAEKIATELLEGKIERKLEEFGLKPFFSLHPARGGIDSKEFYPRGVLGDNKDGINKLIRRML